jgi:hypothetical protein
MKTDCTLSTVRLYSGEEKRTVNLDEKTQHQSAHRRENPQERKNKERSKSFEANFELFEK